MRTLTSADFDALHTAFVEAFSDYVVKLAPTREQLAEMTTRRGYVPEASVAELEGERVVAFTLNGIDGTDAYDTGTGVVPSHRRRGLGKTMLDFIEPILRERGCTRYVLEVLEANAAARALYLGAGFVETRGLRCWTYATQTGPPASSPAGTGASRSRRRRDAAEPAGGTPAVQAWWDIQPSWQNTTSSIARAKDRHVVLGNDDGYAIVFPSNGDVAQLAVRPEARRTGLATRLFDEAAAVAGKPLRIMNVDERHEGIVLFLEHVGATRMVRQIEMEKLL